MSANLPGIRFMTGVISPITISTILGHNGSGAYPMMLSSDYRQIVKEAKKRKLTILAKSSTYNEKVGNYKTWNPFSWRCIRIIKDPSLGLVNAYGLTNKGVKYHAKKIAKARQLGVKVIPNFYPEFSKGTEIAIKETLDAISIYRLELGDEFWALEISYSCPNDRSNACLSSPVKITENMEQAIRCTKEIRAHDRKLVLIIKISYEHPIEFIQELELIGVDAAHSINSIRWEIVFPNIPSPLKKYGGGGVSGGPAFLFAFDYNEKLRKAVKLPLIMGCGVMSPFAAQAYADIGADSVSICSVIRINPSNALEIIRYL
ncbi:MAG: hypothetical protein HY764_04090 [Candidatus Portnoybacteria bacterium]|nr:hypothetical protein [Candidatus Portnoybacteria bacterium]